MLYSHPMIDCYVLQVATGKEDLYLRHLRRDTEHDFKIILPKRELTLRRKGKHFKSIKPVFPGYLFWETNDPDPDSRWLLRKIPGFIRFMKDENSTLLPLRESDREIISTLTVDGEIAGPSTIIFDKNNRVKVLKGPLMGQEGRIIKVDRRKRRITVAIEFADKRFKIDLAYQEVEKQSAHTKAERPAQKRTTSQAP